MKSAALHDIVHELEELTTDVARLRIAFANLYFVGRAGASGTTPWVLVDAGLASGAAQVLDRAAMRFGRDHLPSAVILTHGHFDHVGALEPLLRVWDVPVYAHPLELPFLTGKADYPPPDATVGAGLLARISPHYPERGIDLGDRVQPLPATGHVPGMPGWRWVPTPGHTPGHISLFRPIDRVLIAGDAVTTTRQESLLSLSIQPQELNGPPAFFTTDWNHARRSVATLASLKPTTIASGHGAPMRGNDLPAALAALARDFDFRARPRRGRYVAEPVVADENADENDLSAAPSGRRGTGVRWGMLSGVAAAAFAGTWLYRRFGRRSEKT
jgi:glyoxylase-like metal-dependent hydrolase (beta-lactamase superfamily II)